MKRYEVTLEGSLIGYCRGNDTEGIIRFLDHHKAKNNLIDLTYENGLCFRLALKYNNDVALRALLDYYRETKLGEDHDSMVYKTAYYELRKMLNNAYDAFSDVVDSSPTIHKVLEPYLETEGSSSSDQDLGGFEDCGSVTGSDTLERTVSGSSAEEDFY